MQSQLLKKLLFLFWGFCLCCISQAQAINGKVTGENNTPLSGVSVQLQNSNKGTSTDTNGEFSIAAPQGATLVFSFVGYTTLEKKVSGNYLSVVLARGSDNLLSDVVVVGYGTVRKVDLTGAVSTVDSKVLVNRPVNNSLEALQGAAPGLVITRSSGQPGQEGWSANIRGFSSLNGTNSPLVIIDGVEGDLALINPDDIQSISVLKDAAAAAIYGAKSSGGVIIVTTKKGSSGKLKLSYTGLYSINQFYGIPERLHSWQEAEMANISRENAGQADSWSQQQIGWMKDPDSSFYQNPSNPSVVGFYYDLNQIPIVMRKSSPSQNHNLSLSGGNDKTQYLFSMGYYTEDGVFKMGPDGTSRYNARLNLTTKFNSILSLDSRLSYTQSKTESAHAAVNGDNALLYGIYQLRTIYPIFLEGTDDTKYASTGSGPTTYQQLIDGGYNDIYQNNFDGVFTLKAANLVKGLTFRAIYSPHLQQYNVNNFGRTIPLYSYDNTGTPQVATYLNNPNSIGKTRQTVLSHDVQLLADYNWDIEEDHHFHVLGGFQYQYYNYDNTYAQARALISNDIPSLNLSSNPNVQPVVSDDIENNAWVSYFGRFNYDFKQKYLFEATLRNDASSRLAPGHKSQTFPSLSAGWVLSKEPWFNNALGFLDEFKLRASWGTLGNAQLGKQYQHNYDYVASLSNGPNYPFNNVATPSLYQSALPSPGLGWETIETINGGVDLALFNSRLQGSFDYFQRNNNNMLIVLNEPAVLGVTPSTTNAASMKTWGWEASLGWKDKSGQFSYWANFNIGDNKNKITKYLGNVVYLEGINTAIPGMPINSIFGYKDQGYFANADDVSKHAFQDNRTGPGDIIYQDVNNDGKVDGGIGTAANHGDLVYLGNTSPRYNFGTTIGFEWKGFDFSAFFQGSGKRSIMLYSLSVVPFVNSWRMPWEINTDYWTPTNTDARFPRLYAGGTQNTHVSSHWVQDAAYIRLKNLQIGYTLPRLLTEKIKISKARIFFSGEDLLTATKMWYKYYDPEDPNNVSFNYPFSRSYAVGLNLNF